MSRVCYPNLISNNFTLITNFDTYIVSPTIANVTLTLPSTPLINGIHFRIIYTNFNNTSTVYTVTLSSSTSNILENVGVTPTSTYNINLEEQVNIISSNNTWIVFQQSSTNAGNSQSLISTTYFDPNGTFYITLSKSQDCTYFSYPISLGIKTRPTKFAVSFLSVSGTYTCYVRLRDFITSTDLMVCTCTPTTTNYAYVTSTTVILSNFVSDFYTIYFDKGTMTGNDKFGFTSFSLY